MSTLQRVRAREYLERASNCSSAAWNGDLHAGVDLGTSTVVLSVIDSDFEPVFIESSPCQAMRDGVVFDFMGAVESVSSLVRKSKSVLGYDIASASTGFPPGIGAAESRTCRFVIERAGLECAALVDEVSAANSVLDIEDGVVVDVGHGSTGVGVMIDSELVEVGDVPGGGMHINLILAGALKISEKEAEIAKRRNGAEVLDIIRPGIERVAYSIARLSRNYEHLPLHIAGGGLMIPGACEIVSQFLERQVVNYPNPLYITPLGLARSSI